MAEVNVTQPSGGTPGSAAESGDTKTIKTESAKLREAVNLMDCLSQDGFSEIASIAKMALAWLERPDSYGHMDNIADALKTIWGKADDVQNCINCQAEDVGANYIDENQRRRRAAQRQYRESQGAINV